MKLNKRLTTISAAALMGIAPFASKTVQAANVSITKTTMHNSAVYDKNGKSTGKTYSSYQKITVDPDTVEINGSQYYKLTGKNQYIKATNIDGVKRTVEHNAYVYATSTRRANSKLVKKGTTIVTYGGSYKFKNGKRYYRVGGPAKQYVKVANLGDVVKDKNINSTTNTAQEETTVTVTSPTKLVVPDKYGNPISSGKTLAVGTKFTVDRLEYNMMSENTIQDDNRGVRPSYYHIKGTDKWINEDYVKATKKIPNHDIFGEQSTYITFNKDTDVYKLDGSLQTTNDVKIRKQLGTFRVDKLMYIWVPSENKAELFYHPVAKKIDSTSKKANSWINMNNSYVKASDVEFSGGIKLAPSNTPEEAKAFYDSGEATKQVEASVPSQEVKQVRVSIDTGASLYDDQGNAVATGLKKGTPLAVVKLETTSFSDKFPQQNGQPAKFYKLSGKNLGKYNWILASEVTLDN
ncbi:SLAP domain-containing protein [Lactobacillus sp. PSON]|uniref:SLAP domain-containing protein n=1 Tax=Lactobacillus sp. PSON TaxID=3455454 RepID=UPI00404332DE